MPYSSLRVIPRWWLRLVKVAARCRDALLLGGQTQTSLDLLDPPGQWSGLGRGFKWKGGVPESKQRVAMASMSCLGLGSSQKSGNHHGFAEVLCPSYSEVSSYCEVFSSSQCPMTNPCFFEPNPGRISNKKTTSQCQNVIMSDQISQAPPSPPTAIAHHWQSLNITVAGLPLLRALHDLTAKRIGDMPARSGARSPMPSFPARPLKGKLLATALAFHLSSVKLNQTKSWVLGHVEKSCLLLCRFRAGLRPQTDHLLAKSFLTG